MNYKTLVSQAEALLKDEKDLIANMANFAAFVFNNIKNLNWAGFYFLRGDELLLGPFQGKPACVRLKKPKGVCWAAVLKKQTIVVDNVHHFEGHIACDSNSVSEIVIPIIKSGKVVAVFDVDSPVENRFSEEDKQGFEQLIKVFASSMDFSLL